MHLNLPFCGDEEFARLHAAIRLALPILPAIAASSPFVDGRPSGLYDTRLDVYRTNARRVPSVSGRVIPEAMRSREEYESTLLRGIYDDMAEHDPGGVLRHEWVNARGSIARFDRMAIEIRTLDTQECARADAAVAAAVAALVQWLVEEGPVDFARQRDWPLDPLCGLWLGCVREADDCMIEDRDYVAALGWKGPGRVAAGELWQHVVERTLAAWPGYERWKPSLDVIFSEGCLARRILDAAGAHPDRAALHAVYAKLADCLAQGTTFRSRS
jgi:hypothetical protein